MCAPGSVSPRTRKMASTTYGKIAVNHATLPSDSMPWHTHSQIRNQPRKRHHTKPGTSPPVSKSDGCTTDQSSMPAHEHVVEFAGRQRSVSTSKNSSARGCSCRNAVALAAASRPVAFETFSVTWCCVGKSAHGSGE